MDIVIGIKSVAGNTEDQMRVLARIYIAYSLDGMFDNLLSLDAEIIEGSIICGSEDDPQVVFFNVHENDAGALG
jgi:hypothetical protein